ncbi:MAG: hypothetical protein ACM34B_06180 [Nitrospira sp.]
MQTLYVVRLLRCACLLAGLSFQDAESSTLSDTPVEVPIAVTSRSNPAATNHSRSQTAIEIAAVVNGKQLRVKADGQCQHEPNGFIYGSQASLWTVESTDRKSPLQRLSLTVWQLKREGATQMSLDLQTDTGSHRIATVKGGKIVGSGTVMFRPEESGGRFEIHGKDAGGNTIEVNIACPSFSNIVAEGG